MSHQTRTPEHLVVVGASLAGLRAIESARREGFEGRITLIGDEAHAPYDRLPLSKGVLSDASAGPPTFLEADALATSLGVELILGRPATGLDGSRQRVHLADGESVAYDLLVACTGSTARPPVIAGAQDGPTGIHTLRTWDDAAAIRAGLDEGAHVVILGGGFIGAEVASAARSRGLTVTIVEAAAAPLMRSVGSRVGALLGELHVGAGTDLRTRTMLERVEVKDGALAGVVLSDGTELPADLLVLGVGAAPATDWLRGSGIALHDDGGVLCDGAMRTSLSNVYAAGDLAHVPHPFADGALLRPQHWLCAAEQGALAGRNAATSGTEALDSVPTLWSDWYGHRVQVVGLVGDAGLELVDDSPASLLAFCRRGDQVVGAVTVSRPREIMKYRRLIANREPWAAALALAGR